ncbi:hypothetical protein LSTR_LSTR009118 [Laodelphax striatellus]|uniref:Uncharacterized protein n=1 Tax=Laodelphax striatellus TaxID=195883 RepID=A0A482XPN2_LAOST|nr:hypothetical protein LSTR_LSTR009118 [Laodelphax striatellus]
MFIVRAREHARHDRCWSEHKFCVVYPWMLRSEQLEAIDPLTQRVRMNLSNAHAPLFKVSLGALSPAAQGGTLQLVLYAANQKGHSEAVVLEDIAIRDARSETECVGEAVAAAYDWSAKPVADWCDSVAVSGHPAGGNGAVKKRRDPSPCQLTERDSAVKQLELTHGNQQRYVVAYQLKPETKQPDILSRR